MTLDLAEVDARLRAAGIAHSLRKALEQLDGMIVNRSALQASARTAWAGLIEATSGLDTRLHAWLQTGTALALLKRLSKQNVSQAEVLSRQADSVLRLLPAHGLVRARLAALTLGDAHGLDDGQPVAAIALAAWRHAEASEDNDEYTRDVWARAGVLVNELARPALILNLPIRDSSSAPWRPGEPAYLSLRQLLRTQLAWSVAGLPIHVCENPNLLAIAADELGARCAPMVCTDGMPAAAQRTLLHQLVQNGASLRYHGDFDWPGIHIANHVLHTWSAHPWRMSAQDYDIAARRAPQGDRTLGTDVVQACWDEQLAPLMNCRGLAIAEEAVAHVLLEDLLTTE